jgi:hypothetical protein
MMRGSLAGAEQQDIGCASGGRRDLVAVLCGASLQER